MGDSERGRGLGRALALLGLHHLRAEGMRTCTLFVEADNAPALALYRSLGFSTRHTHRCYSVPLTAAAVAPVESTVTSAGPLPQLGLTAGRGGQRPNRPAGVAPCCPERRPPSVLRLWLFCRTTTILPCYTTRHAMVGTVALVRVRPDPSPRGPCRES